MWTFINNSKSMGTQYLNRVSLKIKKNGNRRSLSTEFRQFLAMVDHIDVSAGVD